MKISLQAVLVATSIVSMANFSTVALAQAGSLTCRDYYVSYIDEATRPASTTTTVYVYERERPNFHGHYAEYRGNDRNERREEGGRGGDDRGRGGDDRGNHGGGGSDAGAIIAVGVLVGLSVTAAEEDAELHNSQDVLSIVDQAEMGDGAKLREFSTQVQSKLGSRSVSLEQVSKAVTRANENLEFCRAGDLDSVDELAAVVAGDISSAQ